MRNLHELFAYDPNTGELHWKERPLSHFQSEPRGRYWNSRFPGKVAGYQPVGGYHRTWIFGTRVPTHRIIWEMHNGPIPQGKYVDHIDGDRRNNRLTNLRVCSPSQNVWNQGKQRTNTSGFKGVSWIKSRGVWTATIMANRRIRNLGQFNTPEEAHAAYVAAAKMLHGEFARVA